MYNKIKMKSFDIIFSFSIFIISSCVGNLNQSKNLNRKETLDIACEFPDTQKEFKNKIIKVINESNHKDGSDFSDNLLKDLDLMSNLSKNNLIEFKTKIKRKQSEIKISEENISNNKNIEHSNVCYKIKRLDFLNLWVNIPSF